MLYFIILTSLLISVSFAQSNYDYLPPTDGKYFYSDIITGGDLSNEEKYHAVNVLVSEEGLQFPFALNTAEYYFHLVSTECSKRGCEVPKYYNFTASKSSDTNSTLSYLSWAEHILTYKNLEQFPTLNSKPKIDDFKMQVWSQQRET